MSLLTIATTAIAIMASALVYQAAKYSSQTATSSNSKTHLVVTDLRLCISPEARPPPTSASNLRQWRRIHEDLYLYKSDQIAWLDVEYANENDLSAKDMVVVDITVGKQRPQSDSGDTWESHSGGVWVLRSKFSGNTDQVVTEMDVLFGTDAVDPRPHWDLMQPSLRLNALPEIPVARLTVLRGRVTPRPDTRAPLRVKENGEFKIMQISDTHMVTGVGICDDAIDAHGEKLSEFEADPRTVDLIGKELDKEKPDLVVLAGDLLHHDIPDSKSALFKVLAPIIQRSVLFIVIFGNHDSEGSHALSRKSQMSILQDLPGSLSEAGPEQVDGIGNFCLDVLAPIGSDLPADLPVLSLYFLDSHGSVPRGPIERIWNRKPDYLPIQQSQIDWFTDTSQKKQRAWEQHTYGKRLHVSMAFQHIPVPEFNDPLLEIRSGHRGEPTEGPSVNSNFFDALAEQHVVALACAHDHVNDFCALLPRTAQQNSNETPYSGPWLCYGGAAGFGGYCSYGKYPKRFYHRRVRVWEFKMGTGSLKTWMRYEYGEDRVDELELFRSGSIVDRPRN